MRTISTSYFRTHGLTLLTNMTQNSEPFILTRYGKPIAKVLPLTTNNASQKNPLENSLIFEKDAISPIWNTP